MRPSPRLMPLHHRNPRGVRRANVTMDPMVSRAHQPLTHARHRCVELSVSGVETLTLGLVLDLVLVGRSSRLVLSRGRVRCRNGCPAFRACRRVPG